MVGNASKTSASSFSEYVLEFEEIDRSLVEVVGGKGAQLAELSRIEGIRVPAGYCVTTAAFHRVLDDASSLDQLLDQLPRLRPGDRAEIAELSARVRTVIETTPIPADLAQAVIRPLGRSNEQTAYAVRSSATAEDLPTASFAGQQDTYLNVIGPESVLEHIRRCWASLFTERAVTYRLRNDFDGRKVHMAVVVQQMVAPQASGILFTADPVTSNRRITSIEASFGLGEALVSGVVNPDVFQVRDGAIIDKTIAAKQLAIYAAAGGGTRQETLGPDTQRQPALRDAQVVTLDRLARRIEQHFGRPQDIEWCLVDGAFQFVQSRPITTLFPIPETEKTGNRLYVSVGHQQMMTDPFRPLGLSFWQMTTPAPMAEAGGRLFVDVTERLATPSTRAGLLEAFRTHDPLLRDALDTVLDRGFLPTAPEPTDAPPTTTGDPTPIEPDPAIPVELIARNQESLAVAERNIATKRGAAVFDFILEDFQELRQRLFDREGHTVFMAAMDAAQWLNDHLHTWLGDDNAADVLTQSAPNNVTSEMGLALLEVADVIRPHPQVVAFLRTVEDDDFLDRLPALDGGSRAREAIRDYLHKYGMRCVGEIDITRPRWSEHPSTLVPLILTNIENFEPGAGQHRFDQGREEARRHEQQLLERLRAVPDGEQKAAQVKSKIDLMRTYIGYREYPKYGMVSRYLIYKRAMLREAQRLVGDGVLLDAEDIFYLRFSELHEVVRQGAADYQLIDERKAAFEGHRALTPPRVLTSEGEALSGSYRRDNVPANALPGLAVSAGDVEGRARVVSDLSQADLEAGDILVTAFTDPSWTPAFVTIKALVTEVGGMMTHGAVVAREYGLPAVVGVDSATRLIRDGQRIRVHGTSGYVEFLD
ncbi:rifamycin-inactivating phosphotransferase [Nocardia callitridis]|uniref:Phosphoenolpyruvate synthase n=1 Tax=Nocardia callitridis TaxID=648753 RepID=A0ABP9KE92_9NOCA